MLERLPARYIHGHQTERFRKQKGSPEAPFSSSVLLYIQYGKFGQIICKFFVV